MQQLLAARQMAWHQEFSGGKAGQLGPAIL